MKKTVKKILPNFLFVLLKKIYIVYLDFQSQIEYKKHKNANPKDYPELLKNLYKKRTNEKLDWNKIETYNEKMQWAKLFNNEDNEKKAILSDKYLVREWIKEKIGSQYLIPILGAYDSTEEINFDLLPQKYVIKTNNGSGTNIIVKNKDDINIKKIDKALKKWLNTDFAYKAFEMHYTYIKPKIIIEDFIEDSKGELNDYKFLCFDGKVHFCWVDTDRFNNHERNVYDRNWNLESWKQHKYNSISSNLEKPKEYDRMVEIAEILSEGFSHVRVDLYNVDGRIYFGEMTFTNGSGFEKIEPFEKNLLLGSLWNLPLEKRAFKK